MSSTAQTYFILVVILLGKKISEALNNTEFINWQNDDINSFHGTHQKSHYHFTYKNPCTSTVHKFRVTILNENVVCNFHITDCVFKSLFYASGFLQTLIWSIIQISQSTIHLLLPFITQIKWISILGRQIKL